MKPALLPPEASLATFLILSSSKCLPGLLGSRCQQSPSMYLGGEKPPCTTSQSMCTMRVGHLASPMVWRSLLYPSPARLPVAWGVTQLPLPMPHDLPSPDMVASSKWLVRALLTLHAESPLAALPDLPGLEEALPSGSQSAGWLASCRSEVPAQLVERLAAHALSASRDLHLLSLAVGVLLSLLTHKPELIQLIVRGVYGAGRRSVLRSSLLSLRYVGTKCTMPPAKTLRSLLWPPSYKSCCPGPLTMRGPLPFGSCPTHKLARVKARILMPVTPTKTSPADLACQAGLGHHRAPSCAVSATASPVGQSSGLC